MDGSVGSIKLFRSTQKYLKAIDVFPLRSRSNRVYSWKRVVILFSCALGFVVTLAQLLFGAVGMDELVHIKSGAEV